MGCPTICNNKQTKKIKINYNLPSSPLRQWPSSEVEKKLWRWEKWEIRGGKRLEVFNTNNLPWCLSPFRKGIIGKLKLNCNSRQKLIRHLPICHQKVPS